MTCVSDDDLLAFVEGRLPPQRVPEMEAHLLVCGACRPLVAELVRTDADPVRLLPPNGRVGRYELQGPIGAGGMGVVYAARDPQLNRQVALKMLRASSAPGATGAQLRARILREAQAMARLSHPNILAVYDVGAIGEAVFVAMELVDGGSVREWLRQRGRSWREILEVFVSAGRGLAAAHRAGIVHRDFKPENVLIGHDGRVRVTDFGLARFADVPAVLSPGSREPSAVVRVSVDGALAGSPPYMAPEQLRGHPADARSDVFAFCASLYESLYGERPFAGEALAELRSAIERSEVRPPPRGSHVPARMRRVLLRGLRAAPSERFESMDALIAALARTIRRRTAEAGAGIAVASLVLLAAALLRSPSGAAPARKAQTDHEIETVLSQMGGNLAETYLRLGRLDQSAAMLERLLPLNPTWQAYSNLGTVYYFQERYREAVEMYLKAVELNPTDDRMWGNLADASRWLPNRADQSARAYRQAVALVEKLLNLNPRDGEVRSRLAMYQVSMGDREAALREIARARETSPEVDLVLFRSALVYEQNGMRDLALQAIAAALKSGFAREVIERAPPLRALRQDPAYRKLLARSTDSSATPK